MRALVSAALLLSVTSALPLRAPARGAKNRLSSPILGSQPAAAAAAPAGDRDVAEITNYGAAARAVELRHDR